VPWLTVVGRCCGDAHEIPIIKNDADADLIAHAPTDMALLLDLADMAAVVVEMMPKGTPESLGGRLAAALAVLEASE
jgi:hypothetical protein